ncbi:MAG: hypothetical protein ACHP7P_13405 [Terriglobales bacterium]
MTREKEQSTLEAQVTRWLAGHNTQLQKIEVGQTNRFHIGIDLTGNDHPPAPQPLASVLAHKLNHPVDLVVRYTPSSEQISRGEPATTP